jgi:sugar phosphate isomerase/epimerase
MTVPALRDFGMDTVSLTGSLEARLDAISGAGFGQVMLSAADIAGHSGGTQAAIDAVRASGLRVTGLQVLRDFEGLDGHLREAKTEVARAMLEMCAALGCRLLLACSSTLRHASPQPEAAARDLRRLAMLALPLGIRIAFEALSWGRAINEVHQAWDVVARADMPNLGLGIDAYHLFASRTPPERLAELDPRRIFLVQLSDFMWQDVASVEERIATARHFRVFPGEGVHSRELAALVEQLNRLGYRGDYSFEVFNDDYRQLPPAVVAARARRSAAWLGETVLRRPALLANR